jgi:hypothetical protein
VGATVSASNDSVSAKLRSLQGRRAEMKGAVPIPAFCNGSLCQVYRDTVIELPAALTPPDPGASPWSCTDTAPYLGYYIAPSAGVSVTLQAGSPPPCPGTMNGTIKVAVSGSAAFGLVTDFMMRTDYTLCYGTVSCASSGENGTRYFIDVIAPPTGAPVDLKPIGACLLPSSSSSESSTLRRPSDIGSFCRRLWGTILREIEPPQAYRVVFNEEHFAARLVSKIKSPLAAVEAAIVVDLQARAFADSGFPDDIVPTSNTFTIPFDDEGTPIVIAYRPIFLPDTSTISIGTVYISK